MKSIIFSAESVQAILDGRKTMTRRVIKPQPEKGVPFSRMTGHLAIFEDTSSMQSVRRPYHIKNVLWVRETWQQTDYCPAGGGYGLSYEYVYKADEHKPIPQGLRWPDKWCSPMFMPKNAARLFLRVADVRVERLQDIGEEDALREGIDVRLIHELPCTPPDPMRCIYSGVWDRINGKRDGGAYKWDKNPWVWVIGFERIEKPEGV